MWKVCKLYYRLKNATFSRGRYFQFSSSTCEYCGEEHELVANTANGLVIRDNKTQVLGSSFWGRRASDGAHGYSCSYCTYRQRATRWGFCRDCATTCTSSARSLRSRLRRASGESRPSCPLGVPASPEGSPFHSVLSLVAFRRRRRRRRFLSLQCFLWRHFQRLGMGVLGFLCVSVTVRIGNEQTIKCSPWFGLIIGKNKK